MEFDTIKNICRVYQNYLGHLLDIISEAVQTYCKWFSKISFVTLIHKGYYIHMKWLTESYTCRIIHYNFP